MTRPFDPPHEPEQLEVQDELDAAEGYDGWDVFEDPTDEEEETA